MLDTHTLVWWVSGDRKLSAPAADAIAAEVDGGRILVSSISTWELTMLTARGRLALSMEIGQWLATLGELDAVEFVPVDNEIAIRSVELPGEFHADPADRIIVATARRFAAPLVTADEKIQAYLHVKTLW